ncbi:hypothetical protein CK203_040830 [Vitis vinifera]|uniref:Uncharacterized protein n=1 Tax=Vitis vinifera TaxID=29760 RepID=A0A438H4U4_VITVI|nr:hypothetical protein CK203_040830 [Vitis vinifera]
MAFYRVSPFRYGSLSSLIPYVSSPSSLSPPVRTFTLSASISTPHPSLLRSSLLLPRPAIAGGPCVCTTRKLELSRAVDCSSLIAKLRSSEVGFSSVCSSLELE